jgi:hypothetical protein
MLGAIAPTAQAPSNPWVDLTHILSSSESIKVSASGSNFPHFTLGHLVDGAIPGDPFKIRPRIPPSQRCTEANLRFQLFPHPVTAPQSKDVMMSPLGRLEGFWITIIS